MRSDAGTILRGKINSQHPGKTYTLTLCNWNTGGSLITLKTTDLFKQQLAFTNTPQEQDIEPMEVETPVRLLRQHKLWIHRPTNPLPLYQWSNPNTSLLVIHTSNLGHSSEKEESKEDSNSFASSLDGKMPALIPNLNIPVNDGWHDSYFDPLEKDCKSQFAGVISEFDKIVRRNSLAPSWSI